MLWRDDPRADAKPFAGDRPSWPKNGAVLKGVVHTLKGRRYLEVGGHLLPIVPSLVKSSPASSATPCVRSGPAAPRHSSLGWKFADLHPPWP